MNRSDFQQLSELRLNEAQVLMNNGLFDGAYYLLGYALECAFKACISKQTQEYDFPPSPEAAKAIYKHRPLELLKASNLKTEHDNAKQASAAFADNWKTVELWSEQSRYQTGKSENEVADFLSAMVADEGVLTWLKKFW
jgi:hypothetical protein